MHILQTHLVQNLNEENFEHQFCIKLSAAENMHNIGNAPVENGMLW